MCAVVLVGTPGCQFEDYQVPDSEPVTEFAEVVLKHAELGPRKSLAGVNADGYILAMPSAVVVDDDSSIYISDWATKQIVRYTDDFRFIASFGGLGEGPGEFRDITTFALLDNEIIVYDEMSRRLTVLSKPDGEYLRQYGTNDEYSLWPRQMLKSTVADSAYYALYKMPNTRPGGQTVEASSHLLHRFTLGQEEQSGKSVPFAQVVKGDSSTFTDLAHQRFPGFVASGGGRVCYAPYFAEYALYCIEESDGDALTQLTGPSGVWPLRESVSIQGEMPQSTTLEEVSPRARMISYGGSKWVGVVHNENIGLVADGADFLLYTLVREGDGAPALIQSRFVMSDQVVQRRQLELEGSMLETAVASSVSTIRVVSANPSSRKIMFRDMANADIVEYGW